MAYLALYRQHRPRLLAEVVDQAHIVRTLANAITGGRLVHAYLFTGPRGTGKTTVARILARSVNCVQGPTISPCGVCHSCLNIEAGSDLDVIEIDAASNRGIDDIRDLRQSIQFMPESRYRIYIIDEVHMLSNEAFNALLKTLEEPPPHVIFILATTEVHKIPLTILSRCQRFDFHRIGRKPMMALLRDVLHKSERQITDDALDLLADRAQGGLRDALSMLDQCLIFCEGEITSEDLLKVLGSVDRNTLLQMLNSICDSSTPQVLQLLDEIEDAGCDLVQFLYDFIRYIRNYLTESAGEMASPRLTRDQSILALDCLAQAEIEMKQAAMPRVTLELALLRIMDGIAYGGRIGALEARISALELGSDSLQDVRRNNSSSATAGRRKDSAGSSSQGTSATPQQSKTPDRGFSDGLPGEIRREPDRPTTSEPLPYSGPGLDPEDTHIWEIVLERIKKERIALHAILQNGRILGMKGTDLEIIFTQEFHRKILERPENKELLEQLLAAESGRSMQVKVFLAREMIERRSLHNMKTTQASEVIPQVKGSPDGELLVNSGSDDLLESVAYALLSSDRISFSKAKQRT
ncbi:MAG: DNA polymerase III subunit gamma/tau [Symbiobacteriaceae bacterium]|nr:DNA polymerase III subunit gamma/tau [Symbiobacteriaceae bacterium]